MAIWVTSDLHFGHEKVAVEHRGFSTIEAHDRTLQHFWRKRIQPSDTIYVLGDLSAGGARAQEHALDIMVTLPGSKRLILGNHDGPHPRHGSRSFVWWKTYVESGAFEWIGTEAMVKSDGIRFVLSHYPLEADHTDEARDLQWRLRHVVTVNHYLLHGHTHQSEPWTTDREINVGPDAWGMGPVPLGEIVKMIKERQDKDKDKDKNKDNDKDKDND
jgi:calcineurin-like phosphoesterase family protein